MRFVFEVEIELVRAEGKFASREELASLIEEALNSADPGNFSCDNGGEYDTDTWNVVEVAQTSSKPKKSVKEPVVEGSLRTAFDEGRVDL